MRRKAFFSFHYGPDIMRNNVVRNAWRFTHPDNAETQGFFDGSLWESKKLEGPEAVKRLIRDGVCNADAAHRILLLRGVSRRTLRYPFPPIEGNQGNRHLGFCKSPIPVGLHERSPTCHPRRVPDRVRAAIAPS